MIQRFIFPGVCAFVAGCTFLPVDEPDPRLPDGPDITVSRPEADTPRPQRRARTTGPDASGQGRAALGTTLASLGSPTEQGMWLRTGLVSRVQQGRVVTADGGTALRVELRPSGAEPDAGSQLSLAAFRTLGAPLTQLLDLQVFAE